MSAPNQLDEWHSLSLFRTRYFEHNVKDTLPQQNGSLCASFIY